MSVPVKRGTATIAKGAATASPANPTGLTVGDLDILIAVGSPTAACSITANGNGGSWSAIPLESGSWPFSTAANYPVLNAWYRIVNAAPSAPTVTRTGALATAMRVAYQGGTFDPNVPFEKGVVSGEGASDTSFSFAVGQSTTKNDCKILAAAGIVRDANTAGTAAPWANASVANGAVLQDTSTNAGTASTSVGVGSMDADLVTAGSMGTFSSTWATASFKEYFAVAIRPVPDTTPPVPSLVSESRNRISAQATRDACDVTWSSSEDFTNYMLRVVPSASSTYTEGSLIEQDQNPAAGGTASTQYTSTITDDELAAASPGDGTKIVKLFTRDAAGNWST